jgi:outer membrane protein OmpA-like peptidoglycan-associated protein
MRRSFEFPILFLAAFVLLSQSPLRADDGTLETAGPEASTEASESAQEGTLRQFPQAEMAPVSAVQGQAAASGAENTSGINFPKVKTTQDEELAKRFSWWPSDAKPAPVKDPNRSGYWWWPDVPGEVRPWGNQGWVYIRKVIFDYKSSEGEMRPSLIIKRVIKNVKVLFDYDKADLRDDAQGVLDKALFTLDRNAKAEILITGNADIRGSEQYNQKLGEHRADSVRRYLLDKGLPEARIRILSRGKLDAMAPTHDLEGMQKDRNAQFVIAEVEEVMLPASKAAYFQDKPEIEERQTLESASKVDVKEYTIKAGDTLWSIAKAEYGNGMQWKRIYEFNKEIISNPDRPKKGTKIRIPIE